jgi:hypothetical protein
MTSDDLAAAGRALYGARWQTGLAHDLHISDRTMRRWLAGNSPIPEHVEREVRAVLLERFSEIGGIIAFDITPEERTIFHQKSAATFRYDEAGNLTPVLPAAVPSDKGLLIEEGAKEKLRQFQENIAPAGFTWAGSRAQRRSAPRHGFMRGSVVIPPDVDLTAPVINQPLDAETGELPE